MIDPKDMDQKAARLRRQFDTKLGVRGKTLAQVLRRTGRQLPRKLRRQGAVLVKAQGAAGHPKLARTFDGAAVDQAYRDLDTHLNGIDVADARKGRILSLLGGIAFNLLLIAVAVVVILRWRGYV